MTHVQEDLSLSVDALEKIDTRTLQALRKLNKSYKQAVFSLAPPRPADDADDETRERQTRHFNHFTRQVFSPRYELCSDVLAAQDAFAALCKGEVNDLSERSPSEQLNRINKALAHKSVEPYEICPGYKGTKEDMKRQASRHLSLCI